MDKLKTLISKYEYNASDSAEIRLEKSLIFLVASFCCICGIIWGYVFFLCLGFGLTSALPFLFVVIVFPSIAASHYFSNYKILVHMQVICITWVPCVIQWSLGSVHDSGFILTWCFLGPLGALLYLNEKHAIFWMLVFILIVCISVIFVPCFSEDADQVSEGFRLSLYLMNVITPFMIIFLASRYFFNGLIDQRKKNLSLLKSTREKNIRIRQSLKKEKELGELKSSFVSTASHQFRTPLAAIQSNSELLQILSNNLDEETAQRYKKVTGRITGEIGKMTELMDDVLILGKLTSGNVDYKPQELNLVDFCQKLAKEFDDVQPDGRIMNIITDGEPYNVYLDPKLLYHSLSNLFSNAFKYSLGKQNPELAISFKQKEFVLLVTDYGIGIPKDELSKLFQPFFRANNVTEIKGTGRGLSIAREYIEINRGKITAKSIVGQGSSFEIKFNR